MDGKKRDSIKIGMRVETALKRRLNPVMGDASGESCDRP